MEDFEQRDLERFTRAYIVAMLWSSSDESDESGGEPLDANYSADDLAPEALAAIESDCKAFYTAHSELWVDQYKNARRFAATESECAGHDFWLTRAGHGAGFWDGDWEEPAATTLTDACKAFGEVWPYVGDDGLIYLG